MGVRKLPEQIRPGSVLRRDGAGRSWLTLVPSAVGEELRWGEEDPTCTTEPDPPQGAVGDGAYLAPSPLDKWQVTTGLHPRGYLSWKIQDWELTNAAAPWGRTGPLESPLRV